MGRLDEGLIRSTEGQLNISRGLLLCGTHPTEHQQLPPPRLPSLIQV